MLIDSDVLIWAARGNVNAKNAICENIPFNISVITYMEVVQGVLNKRELDLFKRKLTEWQTNIIHINRSISVNAMHLVETYHLSHSMELADAEIAATALEYSETLLTGNDKHYKFIPNIKIKKFIP